jgi:AcrR family transcriptional regulator
MNRMPVAARREQLIEAALSVASRDGIDAATVRAVAAEAGVSLGVVHYCFQDKDELLRAVADTITVQNRQAAEMGLPQDADLRTTFHAAVKGLWESIRVNRGAQLLSYELTTTSLRHAELNQVAIAQYRGQWNSAEVFLENIEQAVGITWLVPRARLARSLVAVVDGIALAWLVDGDDEAATTTLAGFADFLASQAATFPRELIDGSLTQDGAAPGGAHAYGGSAGATLAEHASSNA